MNMRKRTVVLLLSVSVVLIVVFFVWTPQPNTVSVATGRLGTRMYPPIEPNTPIGTFIPVLTTTDGITLSDYLADQQHKPLRFHGAFELEGYSDVKYGDYIKVEYSGKYTVTGTDGNAYTFLVVVNITKCITIP